MRNISFFLTTDQIRRRTKTVTRRLGWKDLKPGTYLQAVVKGQGIKKGEQVERLATIRVVSVKRERLDAMLATGKSYGYEECVREGFPHMKPREFVDFFCRGHRKCTPGTEVTRILFEYIR